MHIVMTGATSGFGLIAAQRLAGAGHELTVGARSPLPDGLKAERVPLDLDSLAGVRGFAETVLAGPKIDALLLNAGLQLTGFETSADGFERTFAVNHLAHYLLARLLLPQMTEGGRIVLTGSGTHDPVEKTGIPAPRHADAQVLAYPDRDPQRDAKPGVAGRRAYSSSKLCNIMTARELATRTAKDRPDLSIMAFDPAFVPGTGLARSYGAIGDFVFRRVFPLFIRFGSRVSTPAASGACLAMLAADPAYAHERGAYWSVRSRKLENVAPSALAQNDEACAKLWDDSAEMAGL